MSFVYVLLFSKGIYYIGIADDVVKLIKEEKEKGKEVTLADIYDDATEEKFREVVRIYRKKYGDEFVICESKKLRNPQERKYEGVICYKCSKTGHYANNCPMRSVSCFKCKKIGHYGKECRV